MIADSPSLALYGGPPERLAATGARRVVLTLPWADGPLPDDPWLAHLLPRQDYNRALLDRLVEAPPPPGAFVGLFLADPLLRLDAALPHLAHLGVAGVAAFPGLSRFRGGFGDALAQAGLSLRREAERLDTARAAGFATLAALWDGAAWPEGCPPPDHVLAPGPGRSDGPEMARWVYPARPPGCRPRDILPCPRAPQSP